MAKLSPWSELYLQAVKWAAFAGNNRDALAAAAEGWSARHLATGGGAVPFPDVDELAKLAAAVAASVPADFAETRRRLAAAIALAKAEWDAFEAGEKAAQAAAEHKRFPAPPPALPELPRNPWDERADLA
jgi:hypothetical protein